MAKKLVINQAPPEPDLVVLRDQTEREARRCELADMLNKGPLFDPMAKGMAFPNALASTPQAKAEVAKQAKISQALQLIQYTPSLCEYALLADAIELGEYDPGDYGIDTNDPDLKTATAKTREALRQLRQKGFCAEDSLDNITDRIVDDGNAAAQWLLQARMLTFRPERATRMEEAYKAHKDEIWLAAIEEIAVRFAPQLWDPDEPTSFTRTCRLNYVDLYLAAINYAAEYAAADLVKALEDENIQLADKLDKKDAKLKKHKADTKKKNTDLRAGKLEKLQEDLNKAKSHIERVESERRAILDEKIELSRQMSSLEKEIERLKSELLTAQKRETRDIIEAPAPGEAEDAVPATEKLIETPPFPEDGVVFLGGHINLHKKIKQIHPNWTYISEDDDNTGSRSRSIFSSSGKKVSVLLMFTGHISHSLYHFVDDNVDASVPRIFLPKSTNVDTLETAIAEGWEDLQRRAAQQ